ncbi:MAG TPA: hypothetical protein VLE51_00635 [Candidatus Saccharimonadales bacterium]|nr:hypothetical protein [Candidatus Saccharimonadales bacterium]
MSKNLNFDLKTLLPKLKKMQQKLSKHFPFAVILGVLLVYLFVVWHIRTLATAEPSNAAQEEALLSTKVAKIDQKAIAQIQSLEQNSPEVHSLFNDARNNPFHE